MGEEEIKKLQEDYLTLQQENEILKNKLTETISKNKELDESLNKSLEDKRNAEDRFTNLFKEIAYKNNYNNNNNDNIDNNNNDKDNEVNILSLDEIKIF